MPATLARRFTLRASRLYDPFSMIAAFADVVQAVPRAKLLCSSRLHTWPVIACEILSATEATVAQRRIRIEKSVPSHAGL